MSRSLGREIPDVGNVPISVQAWAENVHLTKTIRELIEVIKCNCNKEHGLDPKDDWKYHAIKQARISIGEVKP